MPPFAAPRLDGLWLDDHATAVIERHGEMPDQGGADEWDIAQNKNQNLGDLYCPDLSRSNMRWKEHL
jgi:hypothetical protein